MVPRESFLMAPINIEIDDVMSMNHGFWNYKSNLQMLVLTIMTEKYTHKLPQRISDWFSKTLFFERIFITGRLSLRDFAITKTAMGKSRLISSQ